ncbi:hypothetical protein GGX14DRAFT_391398 [Mycena pura]|uniref:Uncharacterized protein n=1 Tax=Mycena pura TaxID=153505 RepID=A0AAD6VQA6_9AGAR|nr:hypothetical protein GGX14DRAFT_391398 [Mycena pura]
MASEMLALVEFVRYNTRTASAVTTPMHTGEPRNRTVVDQPYYDGGILRERTVSVPKLEAAHGLPYQMGETTYGLVKALTGIEFPIDEWNPDVPQNAFLAHPTAHIVFGEFRIWLDFTPDGSYSQRMTPTFPTSITSFSDLWVILFGSVGEPSPRATTKKIRLEDYFEDLDAKLRSPNMDCSHLEFVKFDEVWIVANDHCSALDNNAKMSEKSKESL